MPVMEVERSVVILGPSISMPRSRWERSREEMLRSDPTIRVPIVKQGTASRRRLTKERMLGENGLSIIVVCGLDKREWIGVEIVVCEE